MLDGPPRSQATVSDRPQGRDAARLEVFVSSECCNCDEAMRLAEEAALRYPDVVVRVVDLELGGSPPPDLVVAVPTYILNGRVISLGNPYPEELFARLQLEFGSRPNFVQTGLAAEAGPQLEDARESRWQPSEAGE